MAMDVSFNLGSAVERFLNRCPELRGVKKLDDLLKKGNIVTVEEVVSLMAELFLNPNYTIPLMGCFRPIARKIVDEAVSLLRHCNLSSNNADDDSVVESGCLVEAGVVFVIEHYARRGRGLYLHELACLAFCRALDLNSSLLGSISAYYKFAPPPFERLLVDRRVLESKVACSYLLGVRVSYRLLVLETEFFSNHWDWSPFLDCVNKSDILDKNDGAEYVEEITDIRWCGIQIWCIIMKLNDRAIENFGLRAEEAAASLLRWEEFCQDVAIEKIGLFVEPSEHTELGSINECVNLDRQDYLKLLHFNSPTRSECHEIQQITKRQKLAIWDDKSAGNIFVMTSTVKKSFEMVLLSINQKWPVLLYGPAGSGKTALINKLASDTGNQVLSLHMDDQIDGKTLIGSYVCAEQPGEFRWQPGSLVQAVVNGYWVVLEDIDKASSDVQSILMPLLEGATFFVTGHGEEINVAESFRLFSTISASKSDSTHSVEVAAGNLLNNLWRRVMIGLPSRDDVQSIVRAWYPNLEPLVGNLLETMGKVSCASEHNFIESQPGKSSPFSFNVRLSLRDLLKWCKRIAGLGFSSTGVLLRSSDCHSIFREAVDIFAASLMSTGNRLIMMKEIAKLWGVPDSEAENLCAYIPQFEVSPTELRIGRVTLQRMASAASLHEQNLVKMRGSLQVLEKIACSIKYNEPVLLVGETGIGKTTLVQKMALMLGQRLTVLNLSQQSDVADLLGGFKPMDPQSICFPLYKEFEDLFSKTFSVKENDKVLAYLQKQLIHKNWRSLLSGFKNYIDKCLQKVKAEMSGARKKRTKPSHREEMLKAWMNFSDKVETAHGQTGASSGMVFSFVEGAFVTALRRGEWILLDEMNLAPPETLQRLVGVLEGEYGSLCLAERGDISHIPRHSSFRVFACMNPATDAGKRDLPYSLRSRFTEYFVDDVLHKEDLKKFINEFMVESQFNRDLEKRIIDFYETVKKCSEEKLQDGANQKPQYSLRSLYRALEYTNLAKERFKFQKAMYDGFCMFFLTLLDRPSAMIVNKMITDKLLGGCLPSPKSYEDYLGGEKDIISDEFFGKYVLTESVKKQLENLARAVFIKKYPVLLQGPTSSGKTSLVQYLAAKTGHEFVRINNHEHTDLQEYLGSYVSDACGRLVFQEGALVKAVRNGYWIVLDELNLAPSDVLEALNRLLDDNRELYVPELRETVRPHPSFMLFATQNPPTFYGGRKLLSRAFRNRFVELHVEEIPDEELITIIEKRCGIPPSRAKTMVKVMKDLQLHRQNSKVFAGKHGFITPRDLFRWANRLRRFGDSKEVMAEHGYYLLADRLRNEVERDVVRTVLKKHLGVEIVDSDLYKLSQEEVERDLQSFGDVILTKSMRRLYFLVKRSYELREPVLLVGETGGGKTTVCQLLSRTLGSNLQILNCHQYTETADFLGGFYPIRERSRLSSDFKELVEELRGSKAYINFEKGLEISSDIDQASSTLNSLASVITYLQGQLSSLDLTTHDIAYLEGVKSKLEKWHEKWQKIFMWQDGPLVKAMKCGDLFLVDEISLADDSVLERLNSVLEPERKLSLAEKGGPIMDQITAHGNFLVLATMNPGGDYGKKELSPALRNRFTEIWVPPVSGVDELRDIASKRFCNPGHGYVVDAMLNFWEWFNHLQAGRMLTVRDLLSWIGFVNVTEESLGLDYAILHGLFLVLLDGLSLGTGMLSKDAELLREKCLSSLLKELKLDDLRAQQFSILANYGWGHLETTVDHLCSEEMQRKNVFGIHPFYVEKGSEKCNAGGFEFLAPTTRRNALRVLRAMQLQKPVLLEGSPGVGKTSLIMALGKYSGHKVVRINLSEQTDLMDLLGSDLPVENDKGMKFAWSDGILLQALKDGCWVLLDELNLAPQSVLEGLNAILDHRAEVFIPELGLTFKCPSSFRVFACQNPISQGGGRKGLPRSFMNRFTKVYVDELVEDDYIFICSSLYPSIPRSMLSKLIYFNKRVHEDIMLYQKFAQNGLPWEFNLRDVIRSCQIIQAAPENMKALHFVNIVYVQRMRTVTDRKEIVRLCEEVFGDKPLITPYPRVQLNPQHLIVGNTAIKRSYIQSSKFSNSQLNIMPCIRHSMEAVAHCVQHQWLCILVGPSSSGKTSLIRLLAHLTGNVLNELNLSSATEISELLGCFEQYNAFRNFRVVVAQVERYVNEYCSLQLESSKLAFLSERKDMISTWLAFLSSMKSGSVSSSFSVCVVNWDSISGSLDLLLKIIEQLKLNMVNNSFPVSWSGKDLNKTIKAISKLQEDQQRKPFSAKFEWVAGSLIKAIENGEWIVLENANLCNPTVLDRINSLVEPSGSITVNECGIVDGSPVVLHPHPNFRMFLTVNPKYGEVSRAMRNRGVEIVMMKPYWLFDEGGENNWAEFEMRDVKRFLVLSGVPTTKLVDSMAKAHLYAMQQSLQINVEITYLELARWVQLFLQLLMKGNRPLRSLYISWEHTYLSSLGEAMGSDIVKRGKLAYLSSVMESDLPVEYVSYLPGGWPKPLKLTDFIWYSKEISVKQNFIYLEYVAAQYVFGVSSNSDQMDYILPGKGHLRDYLVYVKMMQRLEFPQASNWRISNSGRNTEHELKLARQMLWVAANWTIEQATESDYKLYLLRFSWLSSQLQPIDHLFSSFLNVLGQVFDCPIWRKTFDIHHSSLDLLRLSYQQWNAQSEHDYVEEAWRFRPVFQSLEKLERELLSILVETQSYHQLVELYADLLGDHMVFWDAFISSESEKQLIAWHALTKDLSKLQGLCQETNSKVSGVSVQAVLEEGRSNLNGAFFRYTVQSLLWKQGGHPFLPSSAKLYCKQQQFLELCESIWPAEAKALRPVNNCLVNVVASFNPELRSLAVQGVCMSLHMTNHTDQDEDQVLQQLDEMYKMLSERFVYEKQKLEAKLHFDEDNLEGNVACCIFWPGMLCSENGFVSWLETVPLIDSRSFFLDMELLHKLSSAVLSDPSTQQHAVGGLTNLVESALQYSLAYSTRPPQNFVPHQKILWTLDAWTSVDSVNTKIASHVLEMWFRWHLSLWSRCPASVKNFSKINDRDVPLPGMLVQPVGTASVSQILQGSHEIKDNFLQCLKLRVASANLWWCFPLKNDMDSHLLLASRALLQQIIYAHKKAFDDDNFAAMKTRFDLFQKNMVTQDDVEQLTLIIASSRHQGLNSCLHPFIKPLLRELYLQSSSSDFHLAIGRAWLRIGGLRFNLLLSCDELDPAMKYHFKYAIVGDKILSLELEIKVRQECNYLAGCFSSQEADRKRAEALEKLKIERKRLERKMVFRCDPSKVHALRQEFKDGLEIVTKEAVHLADNIEVMELQKYLGQVCHWQEKAKSVIDRLDEFKDYNDVVQPLQVAVYEMKLGVSLIVTGALQKSFLHRIKEDNVDRVMDSIYCFMKFPRAYASKLITSGEIDIPHNFWELDIVLLEKLVAISGEDAVGKEVSPLQLKSSLHENILIRVAHFVANAHRIDKASFKMMDKIFGEVANTWMNKVEGQSREGHDVQQYKFRPRAFKIKNVLDIDALALGMLLANDTFSEWKELFPEEECPDKMDTSEDHQLLEDEWNIVQEAISNNIIDMHNKLFGSTNLILGPGAFLISDDERLLSFTDSYTMGARMIKGLVGLSSSSLDSKLVAEHQLRLCLELEQILVPSRKVSTNYNFYKDSNTPAMAKMVKPLIALQQQIQGLSNEWEDHPGLQKIKDVIEMLLAIPMDTPLAKALSGLQFLMNRVKILQENGSKFSLSDQFEPLIALVCSWQKMEFDSWPALLDEVQDQYETNAAKLWFPLYSVLHHLHAPDVVGYEQSIIESLDMFIHTSSVGEFRKRLQLLFAFHGQIATGRCLEVESYSSPWQESNLKILYNVFGYYVQFLPRILEHVQTHRKKIELELKEHLKLCRWERPETSLSVENSRRTRLKLRKLIQKYTDVLQQPVMLIFTQEANLNGREIPYLRCLRSPSDIVGENIGILNTVLNKMQLYNKDRTLSLPGWRQKVVDALQSLHADKASKLNFLDNQDVTGIQQHFLASQSAYLLHQECRNKLCQTIDKICKTTVDCNELWIDETKGAGKKRALSEMLKLLEGSGLQKHKFEIIEESNNSKSLFIQPSYDARHLLLTQSRLAFEAPGVSMADEFQCFSDQALDIEWKTVNEFYFQSTASVQVLQRTCLKSHEDITYDQATRSVSFLNHLIVIQQAQRDAAYGFAKHLKHAQQCVSVLESMYSKRGGINNITECCISQNQSFMFKCIWKQKQLFDALVAMTTEESLLLRVVESTHLKSCQSVRMAASNVRQFFEKFIPAMQKAKESLDDGLLANVGVAWSHLKKSENSNHIGIDAMSAVPCYPFVVSEKMKLVIHKNFQIIEDFERHVLELHQQDLHRSPVIESLLANFDDVFNQGKLLIREFDVASTEENASTNTFEGSVFCNGSHLEFESRFDGALRRTFELALDALKSQFSLNHGHCISEESSMNITMWESLFKTSMENMNLKELCDNLMETIFHAEKLVNNCTGIPSLSVNIGACFENLHALLDMVLSFSDGLLKDFLAMHKTVAIMTHVLANVLASLFSKGFRIPAKDPAEDASHDLSQDASGTGMGEGSGYHDVSDQITDEEQLLGSSQKLEEERNDSREVSNKNEKGIEMEDDFVGDTFSVSEESGEDSDDINEDEDEDDQIENAMGEAGASSKVVDEKLWNKDEDENPSQKDEKHESGSSIRDKDTSSRELRAKDDSIGVDNDEPAELNCEELDQGSDEVGDQEDLGNAEDNPADLNMDMEEALAIPSEMNQNSDEMDVDDDMNEDGLETKDETDQDSGNESIEHENLQEENTSPVDETMEEAAGEQVDGTSGEKDQGEKSKENLEMDSVASKKDVLGPGITDLINNHVPNVQSATRPVNNFQESSSITGAPEADVSNPIETSSDVALQSLPRGDTSEVDVMVTDVSTSGRLSDNPLLTELPRKEFSSVQKTQPNPYRNVGDALQDWKERVKVSVDLQAENQEMIGEMDDKLEADEYGYVSEFEKGTAQTLGPATSEQVDLNVPSQELDDNRIAAQKDDDAKMDIDKLEFEDQHIKHSAPMFRHKEEEIQIFESEKASQKELPQIHDHEEGDQGTVSESLVTFRKSFNEDMQRLRQLSVYDNDLGKAQDLEQVSIDVNSDAASVWQRYQLRTRRLSQELAEQLRLVMEPTLASKLQGDYKTGKRINMKKVIPYIASHYRKDKIWLRRTRPNKRDYQVVIAIDDSRSMSESHCGDVAVEALVTVCNAMSQLEMGNLAVASFGKKGNIRLLHDFDQPFTGEAGIKIVSSLTFRQENTIVDEPVADLLKYLNDMLDNAVAKSRLPSGRNPLQQLVLIIADGRFHEKEKLKRRVRDFLSQKRMVAFLLLDNAQESIMDLMEASFVAGGVVPEITNYMDSFPFPYYIVLKNIEALPRTLGDLLRQWLELMQSLRD